MKLPQLALPTAATRPQREPQEPPSASVQEPMLAAEARPVSGLFDSRKLPE